MIAINMEMPKCCHWDCPLCNEDGGACMLGVYEPKTDTKKERAKDCPLVEIITCEDCKYCVMTELGVYCDRHIHRLDTHLDKYCADGERREDKE